MKLSKLILTGALVGLGYLAYKNRHHITQKIKDCQLKHQLNFKVLETAANDYIESLSTQKEIRQRLKDKFDLVKYFESLQEQYIDAQKAVINNPEDEQAKLRHQALSEKMKELYSEYNDACAIIDKNTPTIEKADEDVIAAKNTYEKIKASTKGLFLDTKSISDKVNKVLQEISDIDNQPIKLLSEPQSSEE